jgi:hypothetical protein
LNKKKHLIKIDEEEEEEANRRYLLEKLFETKTKIPRIRELSKEIPELNNEKKE